MPAYWPSCGYELLSRDADGRLVVTDDFLRALLARPELAPVPESCAAELALHAALQDSPRLAVDEPRLATLADADAQANYRVFLRFRDRLLARPTLEASYLQLFRGDVDVPPLLVHQLTQVLLRHVLGDAPEPFEARAAEMLFRPQRISLLEQGEVMAADDETVERRATATFGTLGDLLKAAGATVRSAELDVLLPETADSYWERSEAHDLVLQLNHGHPGLDALCRVIERWVAHFAGTAVRVGLAREIDEDAWVWHVGLDAQASAVLNALYQGQDIDPAAGQRMLCLFRLEFDEPSAMRPEVAGQPVWLAMAMDESNRLRLKPQNLLLNLPFARQG